MIEIDQTKCVGCGKCAADCISLNIEIKDKKAFPRKDCFHCGHCVAICPTGAVSIPEYDMEDVEAYDPGTFQLDPQTLLHAIKFRRSVRCFKQEKVKREHLELLLQAGRYTATAKNNQGSWFVFVQEQREEFGARMWQYIEDMEQQEGRKIAKEKVPYLVFNRRRKADPQDDFLLRNAPAVLFITSDWPLDAGLAAQNVENMAVALGMGALYNGYLARLVNESEELKQWLGIEGKEIRACMLLGYPERSYARTAPRQKANVVWK